MIVKAKHIELGIEHNFTPEEWQILQTTGEYKFIGLIYTEIVQSAIVQNTNTVKVARSCCSGKKAKS